MTDQDFQQQVIDRLDQLSSNVEQVSSDVEKVSSDVEKVSADVEQAVTDADRFNEKFIEYRQATQWVVQLAFGLIASATIITIVSTIFKR